MFDSIKKFLFFGCDSGFMLLFLKGSYPLETHTEIFIDETLRSLRICSEEMGAVGKDVEDCPMNW